MTKENSSRIVRSDANAVEIPIEESKRFWAFDNEGQIHWGKTSSEAAWLATMANQTLREDH